jgi:hypothetical protein
MDNLLVVAYIFKKIELTECNPTAGHVLYSINLIACSTLDVIMLRNMLRPGTRFKLLEVAVHESRTFSSR